MLKRLMMTAALAGAPPLAATAQDYTPASIQEFAATLFTNDMTEDEAYGLGQASWFGDLCSHRYDVMPALQVMVDTYAWDPDAFESGMPSHLRSRYTDGFLDAASAYRSIKSRYPDDWGHAKALTCDSIHALSPGLGTLR